MDFNPDLQDEIRVFQKLINKNEQIPTPSQAAKNRPKFDDKINKNIKNVNKDR